MVNCMGAYNYSSSGVFPSRMSSYGITKFADKLLEGQPTGRFGKPEDFAGLVLFLSGNGGAHLTGNVIEIDGGSTRSGWRSKGKKEKL
jgi:NAD(P)-dependent dehydrogenase (short-subunit alcohol dehydrogenase family)